jgi:RNA polymerase sigma factor (sigma-70 family)
MLATLLSPDDFSQLCDVIKAVARSSGLSPEDAEDFSQSVHLKLLEKNYAPLAQFSNRSSFRTFLTTVVRRLLLDWRNERHGKWRPSACAKRLGPAGVDLDRLLSRDGHSIGEAVAILSDRPGAPDDGALIAIASQLPIRPRVRLVSDDELENLSPGLVSDPLEARESGTLRRRALGVLRRAYRQLASEDRQLLELRFGRSLSVVTIASLLGTAPKPLYRRIERLLTSLRQAFVSAGVLSSAKGRKARNAAPRRPAVH